MARNHCIDMVDPGQRQRGILFPVAGFFQRAQPAVGEDYHEVAALSGKVRDCSARRRQDSLGAHTVAQNVPVPRDRLRRQHRKNSYTKGKFRPVAAYDPVEHGIGGKCARLSRFCSEQVRTDNRARRLCQNGFQARQAKVEVVISETKDIVAQVCKGPHRRMVALCPDCGQFTQRTALQRVTVVEQQGKRVLPGRLGPRFGDETGNTGQPDDGLWIAIAIVVAGELHVKIGRRHQSHARRLARLREPLMAQNFRLSRRAFSVILHRWQDENLAVLTATRRT